jgi:hypothetical protein
LLALDEVVEHVFPEPDVRSPSNWVIKDYRKWMALRGLSEDGTKAELKEKVLAYLAQPMEEQPPILPPKYGPASQLLATLRSMVLMCATMMQPHVEGIETKNILSLRIRIFLGELEKFDGALRSPKQKPVWLSCSNFVCLLNLPESIARFGPMRMYYEGKYLGEKFLQEVKETRVHCPPSNLYYNVLKKMHQGKAIDLLAERHDDEDLVTYRGTDLCKTARQELTGNTRVQAKNAEVVTKFNEHKSISFVICKVGMDVQFRILFYKGSSRGKVMARRLLKSEESMDRHGLQYWKWQLVDDIIPFEDMRVEDYGVLLPLIPTDNMEDGEEKGLYSMATKNWSPAMFAHYGFSSVGLNVGPMNVGLGCVKSDV